jgi:hypothetical protein
MEARKEGRQSLARLTPKRSLEILGQWRSKFPINPQPHPPRAPTAGARLPPVKAQSHQGIGGP